MISTPDFVVFFIVYTLINGLVFFFYAHDKIKAKKKYVENSGKQVTFFCTSRSVWSLCCDEGVPAQDPETEILSCTGMCNTSHCHTFLGSYVFHALKKDIFFPRQNTPDAG